MPGSPCGCTSPWWWWWCCPYCYFCWTVLAVLELVCCHTHFYQVLNYSTIVIISIPLHQDLQCSCLSASSSMLAWHSGYLPTTWRTRWWTASWLRRSPSTARVRASSTWWLTQFSGTCSAVASSLLQTGLAAFHQAVVLTAVLVRSVWRWSRSVCWRISTPAAAWRWSGTQDLYCTVEY